MKRIRKIAHFAVMFVVFIPYIAIVGGLDLLRELWKEA
jgi:hypothetical protein